MKAKKSNLETIKWVRLAINSEKQALGDYLEYAMMTQNKPGKNMFIRLARDEYHHMIALGKELERLQKGLCWENIKLELSPIEEIIPKLDENSLNSQIEGNKNEGEAISLALKAEKKAMSFYAAKSRQVTDSSAKKLLGRLAKMEDAHYQILQAELDSINKTGFWMNYPETSFEAE